MAITTLDGAMNGITWTRRFVKINAQVPVAFRSSSLWSQPGDPVAGTYGVSQPGLTLSNSLTQSTGTINFIDPPGGSNTYLARFQAVSTVPGSLMLCDRLWHNRIPMPITATNGGGADLSLIAFSVTSSIWPPRDSDGATAGRGIHVAVEILAAGAQAPSLWMDYTNSVGVPSRRSTNIFPTANSPVPSTFHKMGLTGSDEGVQTIKFIGITPSYTTGSISLVAYRVLSILEIPISNKTYMIDAVTGGFPRLYDGTVPFLVFVPSTAAAFTVMGSVTYTVG